MSLVNNSECINQTYGQSNFRHCIGPVRPAALFMFAFLGLIDKSLHQFHQLLLCDVLVAETLLEVQVALLQTTDAVHAGDVHHTT